MANDAANRSLPGPGPAIALPAGRARLDGRLAAPSARATAQAYARLAKLDMFDYYLSAPVVWAILPSGERFGARTLEVIGLFLAGQVALCAALCAFDDVTGYRDGSDLANYGPDRPARRLDRKPLISGGLTEIQAVRFGAGAAAAYAALWTAAVALAPHRPAWAVAAIAVSAALGFQYSYGLKLSYHGMQELCLAGFGVAFLLPPHGLLTGRAGVEAAAQALLFGLGPLLFGVYSNTHDIEGDRAVDRPTLATTLSGRGNRAAIAGLSLAEAALVIVPALCGIAPAWFPLLLAPLLFLRTRQFAIGMVHGQILHARRIGIHAHRIGAVLLVAADLIQGGLR